VPPELIGLCLPRITLADDGRVGDAIGPRNKISFPIDAAAETVHAGRTVKIMSEVVFAGPDELDRSLDVTRDLEGLVIKRHAEAAAEASTHEGDVDSDVAFVDAEDFGGAAFCRRRARFGAHEWVSPAARWIALRIRK
jgi:hypothetical protein